MPPVIYKSKLYPSNFPQGRAYIVGASFWLNSELASFDALFQAYHGSTSILMPPFNFEAEVVSDSLTVVFPISTASFSVISGGVAKLDICFPKFVPKFGAESIILEASVIGLSAEGVCYQLNTINVEASAIKITAEGEVHGSITIIQPDPETGSDAKGAYTFEGDLYIVVNLKTKSHTTYRDGNNNALAQTGELTFSSAKDKNVSDAYILARSTGDVRFIAKSGENVERTHNLVFRVNDDGNLVNKKIRLAKGLKAQGWQFSVLSPDSEKLEVRAIDLIVNKSKRRV